MVRVMVPGAGDGKERMMPERANRGWLARDTRLRRQRCEQHDPPLLEQALARRPRRQVVGARQHHLLRRRVALGTSRPAYTAKLGRWISYCTTVPARAAAT